MTKVNMGCLIWILMVPCVLYVWASFGYAIMIEWNWFVVPLGIMELGFWQALGISSLVGIISLKPNLKKDDNPVDISKVVGVLIAPWISLLFCYFIHYFMVLYK